MPHASKVALYALLCFIWGSTWLVIKIGYGGLGPFNVAAIRFFVAGVLCAAIVPLVGARWPRGRIEWLLAVFVGVVLFGADYGLIYWSEQFIDSGLTAILFATLPLITILVAQLYLPGEPITMRKLWRNAARVSRCGGALRRPHPSRPGTGDPDGGDRRRGSLCRHCQRCDQAARFGAAPGVAQRAGHARGRGGADGGVDRDRGWSALPHDVPTMAAIGYLAVAGSVVSFLAYFSLLKTWSVTSLSFISVFTPAIALVLGFVFLDERPTPLTAVGGALVLAGVTLALTKGR